MGEVIKDVDYKFQHSRRQRAKPILKVDFPGLE